MAQLHCRSVKLGRERPGCYRRQLLPNVVSSHRPGDTATSILGKREALTLLAVYVRTSV